MHAALAQNDNSRVWVQEGHFEGTSDVTNHGNDPFPCPSCGHVVPPAREDCGTSHYSRECRRVQKRRERAGRGLPFYVVTYEITRHYGGPEEGGWWYDWTSINEVARVFTFRQAREAVRRFRDEYPTCRRGRHSVIGGADTFVVLCYDEDEFPQESTETPHYE
jgi:hypothetical protein